MSTATTATAEGLGHGRTGQPAEVRALDDPSTDRALAACAAAQAPRAALATPSSTKYTTRAWSSTRSIRTWLPPEAPCDQTQVKRRSRGRQRGANPLRARALEPLDPWQRHSARRSWCSPPRRGSDLVVAAVPDGEHRRHLSSATHIGEHASRSCAERVERRGLRQDAITPARRASSGSRPSSDRRGRPRRSQGATGSSPRHLVAEAIRDAHGLEAWLTEKAQLDGPRNRASAVRLELPPR